jgi:hypothetical protein
LPADYEVMSAEIAAGDFSPLGIHQMTPEELERHRRKVQAQLDEALDASFPASDPVSIVTSQEEEDWGEPAEAPPTAPKEP